MTSDQGCNFEINNFLYLLKMFLKINFNNDYKKCMQMQYIKIQTNSVIIIHWKKKIVAMS